MNIDELKNNWQNVGTRNAAQQHALIKSALDKNPRLKRMKLKHAFEAMCLVVFLVVFYGAFDGDKKPLWVNVQLVCTVLIYIIIRLRGVYTLNDPIKATSLQDSLSLFQIKLKRMALASSVSAFIFGLSLILFFTVSIQLTLIKWLVILGMLLTLCTLVYFSYRFWQIKVQDLSETLEEIHDSKTLK